MRFTSFCFALEPTAEQEQQLFRHAGAARFAYNQGLALVQAAHEARKQDASVKVPYSGFDLINAFNRWKVSAEAGADEAGQPGLPWRREVLAQVFEEALVDLGRGIAGFFRARRAGKKDRGFPRFKKRGRARLAFRIRNKKNDIRVSQDTVRLPKLGELKVRESTRRLRRLLRSQPDQPARAKLLFASVSATAGRWYLRVHVEAEAFHPGQRRAATAAASSVQPVGLDRGLHAFAVAATADGHELWRSRAPKPLAHHLRALRRASRRLSRAKRDGKNRQRRVHELQRLHARIAHIRNDYTHKLSRTVVKTHAHVAIESLNIAGMVRCRSLARAIADVAWGSFAHKLAYKADWYGTQLTCVDRFFPSSKTCHRCQYIVPTLTLAERTFVCPACHLATDRDTNAAANCAAFAASNRTLAAKQVERLNARGEEGSGGAHPSAVKPASMKQEQPSATSPRA